MDQCAAYGIRSLILPLLEQKARRETLSKEEIRRLRDLVRHWRSIDCPDGLCNSASCPYSRSSDALEVAGWASMFDLLNTFDLRKVTGALPKKKHVDIMGSRKRRPGHFNV